MNETKDLHSTEVVTQPKNRRNWVRMMFTVPADASNTVKMIYALCTVVFASAIVYTGIAIMAILVLTYLCLRKYDLDAKYPQIVKELEERRNQH